MTDLDLGPSAFVTWWQLSPLTLGGLNVIPASTTLLL